MRGAAVPPVSRRPRAPDDLAGMEFEDDDGKVVP